MITISHVYYAYETGTPYLLRDLNLTIHNGDYISIVGENGSGKSTFIKLLLGLLKPSRGTLVNDFKRTSYVPQRFETLNRQFPITVREVMNTYRKVLGIKDKEAVSHYLGLMKMDAYGESCQAGSARKYSLPGLSWPIRTFSYWTSRLRELMSSPRQNYIRS